GDRVLEIFAESARHSVRASDLLGRLGGEEFAAVLCDTSREKALVVAERIRERFAHATLEVDNRPVCATVSIGLVHCEEAALDVAELLARADQALYVAKERGRNRVEVATLEMMLNQKDGNPAASTPAAERVATKSAA
ncbi:MAG TPA: GGDEF domain-containing protein, partial [Pseudolabrys sp.]